MTLTSVVLLTVQLTLTIQAVIGYRRAMRDWREASMALANAKVILELAGSRQEPSWGRE